MKKWSYDSHRRANGLPSNFGGRLLVEYNESRDVVKRAQALDNLTQFPTDDVAAQYASEWGRPNSLESEIAEVTGLLQSYERRGGSTWEVREVLKRLQKALRDQKSMDEKFDADTVDLPNDHDVAASAHTASMAVASSDRGSLRVASLNEMPSDLSPLGGGFFRKGHSIWELRAAEDDEGGYVLTRKREEMSVDLRDDAQTRSASARGKKTASTTSTQEHVIGCRTCWNVGRRVAMIKSGQVVPVLMISLNQDGQAQVETMDGAQETVEPEMLLEEAVGGDDGAPDDLEVIEVGGDSLAADEDANVEIGTGCDCDRGCSCPCHSGVGRDPMVPELSEERSKLTVSEDADDDPDDAEESDDADEDNSSEDEDSGDDSEDEEDSSSQSLSFIARLKTALDSTWNVDTEVQVATPFSPILMGDTRLNKGTYVVDGMFKPSPEEDKMYGVPNPVLPFPKAQGPQKFMNMRVRLVPKGGDGSNFIFVTPSELEKHFDDVSDLGTQDMSALNDELDPVMEMPGESVPMGELIDNAPSVTYNPQMRKVRQPYNTPPERTVSNRPQR